MHQKVTAQEGQLLRPSLANAIRCSPLTLLRIVIGLFILSLSARTVIDPDLWGHLRFGLDVLSSGSLHSSDPYSFTSDVPWINHEWLAELLMAAAYTAAGVAGLNLLRLACIAVVIVVLLAIARELKATSLARDLFLALVVFTVYTRMQAIRPQVFSVALFAVLLYVLRRFDAGRPRALWVVPLVFAAWANLHGGWLVGLVTLAVWASGTAFARRTVRSVLTLAAAVLGSVLATLVNPYGVGLWTFLATTVRLERVDITDWKPLLDLPAPVIAIEAILPLVAIFCVARTRSRVSLRDGAIIAMLAAATFRIGRTDAFAQLAMAVLLAPAIITAFMSLERRILAFRPHNWRASLPVGVVAICLSVGTVALAGRELRAIRIEGPWVPDAAGALFLENAFPGGRVLTWFDWGEYAVWHLSPKGIRVSMDGRRETVYSQSVLREHFAFYRSEPGSAAYPDRISADAVWLPSELPAVRPLVRSGWVRVFESSRSVVLARGKPRAPWRDTAPATGRVFPGP